MTDSSQVFVCLNEICRTCLIKSENMKALTNIENKEILNLVSKLSAVSNLEIELNDTLPAFLCNACEEKINICYNFQQLCRQSHNFIIQCLNSKEPLELNVDQTQVDENKSDEETLIKFNAVQAIKDENDPEDSTEKSDTETSTNTNNNGQVMRLEQFSPNKVAEAVEKVREKFFKHTICIKCGFKSINSRALSVHMSRLHKEYKEIWCSTCNQVFEDLTRHKEYHTENDFKCCFCNKQSHSTSHFLEHLAGHSSDRLHKCDDCGKSFISKRHLHTHSRTHSKEKPYKCRHCDKEFAQRHTLKLHLKSHAFSSTCKVCEENFTEKHLYDSHKCFADSEAVLPLDQIKKEEEEVLMNNFCLICNKKVRSVEDHNKKVHSAQAAIESWQLCTYCGKQFRTKSKLNIHIRIHTGETPYKCSFCGKQVTTRNQLVVHERTHTGEKPHVCLICEKRFSQSSVLNTHMRLHTGRPEECNICKKRFCRPAELRLHMRQHTGEKPFCCLECGNTFKQKSHLVEHIKTHSDERPHTCQYCSKGFKQKSSLKSHIRIHLGQKPYKCSQCSYACRQSYSLVQHMLQHDKTLAASGKLPFDCVFCHQTFASNAKLHSHVDAVHHLNEEEEEDEKNNK